MADALIEKILRARESGVPAGGKVYTIRRPTDAEIARMTDHGRLAYVERFVVGWNLVELDVIPGGGPDPVAFTSERWIAHVADHPELWEVLSKAIDDAYAAHHAAQESALKN